MSQWPLVLNTQWTSLSLSLVSLDSASESFQTQGFQMVATNCLELAKRWKIIRIPGTKWHKALASFFFKKNLWIYLYSVLFSWETWLPSPLSTQKYSKYLTTSLWPLHLPSFGINSSRSRICCSYFVFLTPLAFDPRSWIHICQRFSEDQAQNRICSLFTPLNRQWDRCSVNERLHCKHWWETKLPLIKSTLALIYIEV